MDSIKVGGLAVVVAQSFEMYLDFAQARDLKGLRSLSYQISSACNDPAQEEECTRLMDSVYAIGSEFSKRVALKENFLSNLSAQRPERL